MRMSGSVRNWLRRRIWPDLVLAAVLLTQTIGLTGAPAFADDLNDSGKLLATAGGSEVEGAGGGGLASWALITGYGTRDGIGANAHYSAAVLPDYSMQTAGLAVGLFDRLELSYAWQAFDTQDVGATLGLGKGFVFHQNVYGAKLKLIGDAIYAQDSWLPQISLGLQHKENDRSAVIAADGGKGSVGTDFYLAASKLFLAESTLVNLTLRETKANQFGTLGFGGDKHDGYSTQFEGSVVYLFSRRFAAGAELRTKPSNLSIAHEDAAWDLFAAYFLNKNLSLTVAYVDLGNIVIKDDQHGAYLSLQAGL
jgi:hypothetical protein